MLVACSVQVAGLAKHPGRGYGRGVSDLQAAAPLDADRLRAMLDTLAAADSDLRTALDRVGYPAPRQRDPGFATLLRIILAQQVSTASAAALWRKLEAALGGEVSADRFRTLDDAALRACGFSARKVEYARGLCAALAAGTLDIDGLLHIDEEAAIAALVGLRGFGRWSAEIYLLFALGRADVFPADDLAVQIAYQRLKRLDARPSAKALRTMRRALASLPRRRRGVPVALLRCGDTGRPIAPGPRHAGRSARCMAGSYMQDRASLLRSRQITELPIDPSEIGRIVEEIFPEALGVWIYGSFAQGRARRDSDLDIAILPDRPDRLVGAPRARPGHRRTCSPRGGFGRFVDGLRPCPARGGDGRIPCRRSRPGRLRPVRADEYGQVL